MSHEATSIIFRYMSYFTDDLGLGATLPQATVPVPVGVNAGCNGKIQN
jgi:hypothetical protein